MSSPGQMLGFQLQLLKKPGQANLHHRKLDEDDQQRILIFNSMFYKCLITDPEEDSKKEELESI